jgi:hypothetical protein
MRILTLIVATGATLALVAPGAGAKNTLQCSSTAAVKAVAAQSSSGLQLGRDMLGLDTSHPAYLREACKALQSAKAPASASSRLQHDRDSL